VGWRERLRTAVESSGRTQRAIAAAAGVTPETLSRILNSVHARPEFETVVRIAHAADENVGWLLAETGFSLSHGEMQQLRTTVSFLQTTLLNSEPPRRDARAVPNAHLTRRQAELPRQFAAMGARLAYRAVGDTMIDAGIADGDLVFVKPHNDPRDVSGRVVVSRIDASEYVKQLDLRDGRMRLLSRNDRYAPIEIDEETDEFALIGVVVGRIGPPAE